MRQTLNHPDDSPRSFDRRGGPRFEQAFKHVDGIGGWLTRAQAHVLWDESARLPAHPHIVEIGSHQGRSTIILALACPDGVVTAIDPFVEGRLFGGAPTRELFEAHIRDAGVQDVIDLRVARSQDLLGSWTEPIDLLYIDGKHDLWSLGRDLSWNRHLSVGGHVLVHDAFSSIGVTLGLLRHALFSPRLRYLDRTGSLARFEIGPPSACDRLRMLGELPWWLCNVGIKILLRLRLTAVARAFGHHDSADPY